MARRAPKLFRLQGQGRERFGANVQGLVVEILSVGLRVPGFRALRNLQR